MDNTVWVSMARDFFNNHYLTADNLKVWVLAGTLTVNDFQNITGQVYTG